MAAGGPGGHPVSASPRAPIALNVVLYLVVLVLASLAVFGGVLVYRAHEDRSGLVREQERYADVLAAATAEAEAFINIRHNRARESMDKVAAGATGDFRKQYDTSTKGVLAVLKQNRSVMVGEVVWAGVVSVDQDSATVIAATSGTVANRETKNKPVVRNFRLQLDLVLVDGVWLTNDLEFVG